MAERETRRIAHDLLAEPHVAGRRISVRQLAALVEDRGDTPQAVADRFDLDVADVYYALAYYHDHPHEMAASVRARQDAADTARKRADQRRPDDIDPDTA